MEIEKHSNSQGIQRHRQARNRDEDSAPEPAHEKEEVTSWATRLPKSLQKRIKLRAVREETTVQELARELLQSALDQRESQE